MKETNFQYLRKPFFRFALLHYEQATYLGQLSPNKSLILPITIITCNSVHVITAFQTCIVVSPIIFICYYNKNV